MKLKCVALAAVFALGACAEDPVDLHEQGSLHATNTTPHAVVEWHYRSCGTGSYGNEISLRRLPGSRIEPGGSATVQIEADRCFDHRFTLENGVLTEELAVTVAALETLSINVSMPADPAPQGD